MARVTLSDDACDRLVASRDPIDAARLQAEAVADASRRLHDELLVDLAGELSSPQPGLRGRRLGGARRRRAATVVVIAAVAVVGVLALVGSLPAGGGHDGPLDVPAASAAVVLDRAAQAAMRSAIVVPGRGQYGFVKVETGSVGGTAGPTAGHSPPHWMVWLRTSEVKSDWYSADGSGRERIVRTSISFLTRRDRAIARTHGVTLASLTGGQSRVIDGAFPPQTLQSAEGLPYWQMSRLPTQPDALRRAFERLLLASAPNRSAMMRELRADPAQMFGPITQFLFLPTSPQARAALFRVLADLPSVQLLGRRRDRLGRSGIAVAVTDGGPERVRVELLFDPVTSNVLQTETVMLHTSSVSRGPSMPAGTVVDYTDFVSRGVVDSITQLPDGHRLPLRPTSGNR